ncbi:MAG: ATP-binding protein [Actinomycetota bacterium]|nr:ATP-binding protein [Actinomycetota bacterium]
MIRSLDRHLSSTFPPFLLSARRAREFVAAGLRDSGVDEPVLVDRLSLVTSELVTNAVVHAGTDVEVRVTIDPSDVWVEVVDRSPVLPYRSPPSPSGISGRGLDLVDALADAWGVAEVEHGLGKTVWARASRT